MQFNNLAQAGSHLPADIDCHPDNDMREAIIISDYVIDVDADAEVLDEHPSVSTAGEQVGFVYL